VVFTIYCSPSPTSFPSFPSPFFFFFFFSSLTSTLILPSLLRTMTSSPGLPRGLAEPESLQVEFHQLGDFLSLEDEDEEGLDFRWEEVEPSWRGEQGPSWSEYWGSISSLENSWVDIAELVLLWKGLCLLVGVSSSVGKDCCEWGGIKTVGCSCEG